MPFVERRAGAIVGLYAVPQSKDMTEFLADSAAEVATYRASTDPPVTVSKVAILDRLNAVGLISKAFVAMGGPGSYLYERWQAAADQVHVSNPLVVQVLDAIGADKAVILAPETP